MDMDNFHPVNLYTVPAGQRSRINAVAFDYARNQLFWSTLMPAMIRVGGGNWVLFFVCVFRGGVELGRIFFSPELDLLD